MKTHSTTRSEATRTLLLAAAVAAGAFASQAHAGLGSFAPSDGYNLSVYSGNYNWSDVSYYNAGNYGVNSGGGPGPTHIAPDSGKWKVVGQVGGYFTTSAARNAATFGAPPYPTSAVPGMIPIYMVGDHGPGRTDNSSLAFRNDTTIGSAGATTYDYALDTYDTGGPAPASVTSGNVSFGIYFNTSPSDPIIAGGRPLDRFTQSMMDASGNIGVQWGYARDNEMLWRANPSGPWNYTGIHANAGVWDGMKMTMDLTTDTFALDYYNVNTSTWTNLAPAGTAMGTPMTNFTGLRWRLEDGTNGGTGGKNFFDDATVMVPTPGALALLGLGGLALGRRKRS